MNNLFIFLCIILWGVGTFLNRLSVERMPSSLMQVVVAIGYVLFIPIAIKLGEYTNPGYKWSLYSVLLTLLATAISISANIFLYLSLKGNNNSGASTMLISLYPTVTMILSVIFLHEQLTYNKIIGVIMMVIGAIFLSWH